MKIDVREALNALVSDARTKSEKMLMKVIEEHIEMYSWHKGEGLPADALHGVQRFVRVEPDGYISVEYANCYTIEDGKLVSEYSHKFSTVLWMPLPEFTIAKENDADED